MEDHAVEDQINRMVQFIKQEAEEKAKEITSAADEEYNIEKMQLVEAEKQKIRKEYERKEGQVEILKKIEYSTQLNNQRLELLQKRDEMLLEVYEAAKEKLKMMTNSANSSGYETLLCDLIVQGCMRLDGEDKVLVSCRPQDQIVCSKACDMAKVKLKQTQNIIMNVSVMKDSSTALPSASCGGVIVYSSDMKTACKNTLDERLKISYEQCTPKIRAKLMTVGL